MSPDTTAHINSPQMTKHFSVHIPVTEFAVKVLQ